MDPVTAIAAASSAFTLIKKGFSAGRDVESMYSDLGRWMGAISDVNHSVDMAKNPPMFKKLFAGSSVEQEAMEDELRTWINMTHGPNAWNDLLKMQVKIRKQRQETLYAQAEMRRKVLEIASIIIGATVIGIAFIWIFYLIYMKRQQG